jgi:hypothetical protein
MRVPLHLAGFACLSFSLLGFATEKWPSQISLRPARVVSINPHEMEMDPLNVVDRSGREITVSAPWEKVERLHVGDKVWIHDFDARGGDCTSQGTALAGPIPLREGILGAGLLYLAWLGFLAGRKFKRTAQG